MLRYLILSMSNSWMRDINQDPFCQQVSFIYLTMGGFFISTYLLGPILFVVGFIMQKFVKTKNKHVLLAGKVTLALGGIMTLAAVLSIAILLLVRDAYLRC